MVLQRLTMFQVKEEADIQNLIDQYQVLAETNQKDGKPYLLSCTAHKALYDARAQGHNLVGHTTFASLDDVKHYDLHCDAHRGLKEFAKGKVAGPPLVVMWES